MTNDKTLIRVTQQNIDNATAWRIKATSDDGISLNCPIAQAIQEATGDDTIRVGVWYCEGKPLPSNAREFITRFDSGDPVEPIEFEL
jgi:hypothetical protein